MIKKCPDCGSLDVEEVFDNESYCKDCHLHCATSNMEDASVFDHITQSPDVLAPLLVRAFWTADGPHIVEMWVSAIVPGVYYKTEDEAIAATLAKLKEVKA